MTDISPKISVIAAVYNAEKWIHKCLDSLLSQTFGDFELILVDDGSPDRSGEICEEYAHKDSRIRVFHKENGGVSSARQFGLDNAAGEYVIHCDPDDWAEPNWLESLYSAAIKDNADMTICDYKSIYTDHTKQCIVNPSLDSERLFEQMTHGKVHGSMCNKLIRRTLIEKADAKFPIGVNIKEDVFFLLQVLLASPKIAYVNETLYNYVKTNFDSITSSGISDKKADEYLNFANCMWMLACKDGCSKRTQKAAIGHSIDHVASVQLFASETFLKEHGKDMPPVSLSEALLHHPLKTHLYLASVFYASHFSLGIKMLRYFYRKVKGLDREG